MVRAALLAALACVLAVAVLGEGLEELPLTEDAEALDAGDECAASEPGCALSALQLHARKAVDSTPSTTEDPEEKAKYGARRRAPVVSDDVNGTSEGGRCSDANSCPTGLECAVQADGGWSQCVDCAHKSVFQEDCVKLTENLRLAAIKQCKLPCPDSRCYSEEWCPGQYKCAVQEDGGWGQCILCTPHYFKYHCAGWPAQFASRAKALCKMGCDGKALKHRTSS